MIFYTVASRREASRGKYSTFFPFRLNLQVQGAIMKTCKINNCESKSRTLGFCRNHYEKFRKYSDPLYVHPKFRHPEICTVDGCNNKHKAKGYCRIHYDRFKKHGDPLHTEMEMHGMSGTQEYNTWRAMIQRCYYKNNPGFDHYGGRGIIVCERWQKSFKTFLKDMGKRPFPKAQIHRIDNGEDYKPSNCRWVTHTENQRNNSKTKLSIEIAREIRKLAVKMTVIEIAKLHKTGASSVRRIIKNQMWKESIS